MKKPQADVLKGWTKKQIADALKTHSKKELLIMAMQWRTKAAEYEYLYNAGLQRTDDNLQTEQDDDTTTEDTPLESDS